MKGEDDRKMEAAKCHCLKMAQNGCDSVHEAHSSESEEVAESGVVAFAGPVLNDW
jgi:hypothetical protein